jgi:hypothetical protein
MLRKTICAFVLAGASIAFANESSDRVIVSRDGVTQFVLPDGWAQTDHVADAQLEASNVARHEYLEVVSEDARDVRSTLKEYADHRMHVMARKMEKPMASRISKIWMNNMYVVRFELHGVVGKDKFQAAFLVTVMKIGTKYVQVLAWTGESQFNERRSDLEHLAENVSEAK